MADKFRFSLVNRRAEIPQDVVKDLSPNQLDAYNYLNKKHIFDFFQFLICHLLAEQPEDPVAFLGNLLDRCMMFRSGLAEPPLLFTRRHVHAMYRALDPQSHGFISRQQYEAGMKTMNIVSYDRRPDTDDKGNVTEKTFVTEAVECLTVTLGDMLRVGQVEADAPDEWNLPTVPAPPASSEPARPSVESFCFAPRQPPPAPPPGKVDAEAAAAAARAVAVAASRAMRAQPPPPPTAPHRAPLQRQDFL